MEIVQDEEAQERIRMEEEEADLIEEALELDIYDDEDTSPANDLDSGLVTPASSRMTSFKFAVSAKRSATRHGASAQLWAQQQTSVEPRDSQSSLTSDRRSSIFSLRRQSRNLAARKVCRLLNAAVKTPCRKKLALYPLRNRMFLSLLSQPHTL